MHPQPMMQQVTEANPQQILFNTQSSNQESIALSTFNMHQQKYFAGAKFWRAIENKILPSFQVIDSRAPSFESSSNEQ